MNHLWFALQRHVSKCFSVLTCNVQDKLYRMIYLLHYLYNLQTWFYEDNKKTEIGNRKYWIYYKKGIVTVKSGIKKAEFRFKVDEKQVWIWLKSHFWLGPL